jgi:hypothetical protein
MSSLNHVFIKMYDAVLYPYKIIKTKVSEGLGLFMFVKISVDIRIYKKIKSHWSSFKWCKR